MSVDCSWCGDVIVGAPKDIDGEKYCKDCVYCCPECGETISAWCTEIIDAVEICEGCAGECVQCDRCEYKSLDASLFKYSEFTGVDLCVDCIDER